MNYQDLIKAEIVNITNYDLDGITAAAEIKKLEKIISQNRRGKDESVIIYIDNSDLPDILPNISSEINRLYITDLYVTNKESVSQELERIAKSKPKKRYSPDKIFILTDKKIPPGIGDIDRVYVRSANQEGYANLSTSQIVYRHVHKTIRFRPDNSFDILANLGAAADGLLPGGTIYDDTIEKAIELNGAIIQNKNDPLFLDKIVHELAKHGLIKDEDNKEKIKTDSKIFKKRINEASKIIKDGIICNNGDYLVSKIYNKKIPIGLVTSIIRNEYEETVIVFIEDNGPNGDYMLMRGHGKGSLEPVLGVLEEEYNLKGGGHVDSNRPTGYYKIPDDFTDEIIQEITNFCSNPPAN